MAEPKYTKATYHTDAKAAEFIADDGTHVLRSGGSLCWRINNCGNLVSPVVAGQPAPKKTRNYIGFAKVSSSDNFYFIFPDYETGRAELRASLKRKYGEHSIPTMMLIYAPPKDHNDTDAYTKTLLAKTKVPADKKLKDFTSDEFNALMDGIEIHEGYHNEKSNDGVPRKTTVVAVSTIGATDGARPIADEEIVLEADGKKTTLKSNQVGQFPPIPHGDKPITVYHKTADGELQQVGQIDGNKGQHYSLLTRLERFFGFTGVDKPSEKPVTTPPFQLVQYQVKPHDTLGKIADKFKKLKVSVEDLKRFNNLKSDKIFPGQLLSINGPKADGPSQRSLPKKAAPKANAAPAHQNGAGKPALKKAPPPASTPTTFARSNEGDGTPLALVPLDNRRAPWMEVALGEARKFEGKYEALIEKERNYAKEANTGETTITEVKVNGKWNYHAWCAAFVNWCLMRVGYRFDYLDNYDRGRAHAFLQIHGKKVHENDKERPLVQNPFFRQIDQPIFGAIAMVTGPGGHGHHVGFVYAKSGDNELVLLGGNQDSTIKFSPFNIRPVAAEERVRSDGKKIKRKAKTDRLLFFVPTAYYEQAQKDDKNLEEKRADQLNKDFGIKSNRNGDDGEGVNIT
jgi:uncharacterized protein (TIGR02594 family)